MKELNVRRSVVAGIGANAYTSILHYCTASNMQLWCESPGRGFVRKSVLLALYKDIKAIGYTQLVAKVKTWYPGSTHSLKHNTKELRKYFAAWAQQYIQMGTIHEWKEAVKYISVPDCIKHACLLMDSVDLRLIGKQSTSKKDDSWSYKANSPAQRYMVLVDAKGIIRRWWGGYTPKLYDGHFVQNRKRWFEQKLKGAGVVADQHFQWGAQNLKKVKFYTPFKNPPTHRKRGRRSRKERNTEATLTKAQQEFNKKLRRFRAKVELPFARIQAKFKALQKPWQEEERQQDYLVELAFGVINFYKL